MKLENVMIDGIAYHAHMILYPCGLIWIHCWCYGTLMSLANMAGKGWWNTLMPIETGKIEITVTNLFACNWCNGTVLFKEESRSYMAQYKDKESPPSVQASLDLK